MNKVVVLVNLGTGGGPGGWGPFGVNSVKGMRNLSASFGLDCCQEEISGRGRFVGRVDHPGDGERIDG